MGLYVTPYSIVLYACALATCWAALSAWRQRTGLGIGPAMALLGTTIWPFGYAVALSAYDPAARILWAKIQHIGIALSAIGMIVFIVHYIGRPRWFAWFHYVLLSLVPAVGLILAWTNEAHHLIWTRTDIQIQGAMALLDITYGPYFWLYTAYNYAILLFSAATFLRTALRTTSLRRQQALVMLTGVTLPAILLSIYLMGGSPFPGLDLAPIGWSLCGLVVFGGWYRYGLFDIVPIARDKVIENLRDGMLVLDPHQRVVDANPAMLQFIGQPVRRVVGQPIAGILGGKLASVPHACESQTPAQLVIDQGADRLYLDVRGVALYDRHDKLNGSVAIVRDISADRRAQEALRVSEERYRLLAANASDVIWTTDLDGRFTYFSPSVERLVGCTPEEMMRETPEQMWTLGSAALARAQMGSALAELRAGRQIAVRHLEVEQYCRNGSRVWVEISLGGMVGPAGDPIGLLGISRDITERKRVMEQLRELSLVDELTGLTNRRGFMLLATQQLKNATRLRQGLVLLYADLDGLKSINDNLGHQEGNQAIVDMANILKNTLRPADLVARLGGDEFVGLAIETGKGAAEAILIRLHDHLNGHNQLHARRYRLSVSIGVVEREPRDPGTLEDLLAMADRAMYEQKQVKEARRNATGWSEF